MSVVLYVLDGCVLWLGTRSGSCPPSFPFPCLPRCGAGVVGFLCLRCLEFAMPVRRGLRFPLVSPEFFSDEPWVGFACGPIAPVSFLVAHPRLCVRVARWLVVAAGYGSFRDRCAAACELSFLGEAGGVLPRSARRLVGWWVRAGRPAPWTTPPVVPF
jgi:hypothetical protein